MANEMPDVYLSFLFTKMKFSKFYKWVSGFQQKKIFYFGDLRLDFSHNPIFP